MPKTASTSVSTSVTRRSLIAAAAASLLVGVSPLSHAGAAIVYDPVNWVENALSAYQSVQEYIKQLESYYLQGQQYYTQVQQLKSLSVTDARRALVGVLDSAGNTQAASLMRSVYSMSGGVESVMRSYNERLSAARSAGLSTRAYLDLERDRLQSRQQAAVARLEAEKLAMQRVDSDYAFVRDMGTKIASSEGTHQAMQLMSQSVLRMITTTSELHRQIAHQMGSQDARKMAEEDISAAANKSASDAFNARTQTRLQQAADGGNAAITQFRSLGGAPRTSPY